MRLGILDTIPRDRYLPGLKKDPEKFQDLFALVDAPFTYRTYQATESELPAAVDECDAWLITGSPCSVLDPHDWLPGLESFVRDAFSAGRPQIGICFGHQLIGRALGGEVERAESGWMLGLYEFEVVEEEPWMTERNGQYALYFVNQDQVVTLPPGAKRLAASSDCDNVMFVIDERVLALQAHPEQPLDSMKAFTRELRDHHHLDPAVADAALESMATRKPDARVFAGWLRRFLLKSRAG